MLDRSISAVVAVSLACLVWLYVRSRDQEILDNVNVPVQISLPPDESDHYELEITGPSQVPVTFAGPPARIRELRGMLQRGELHIDETLTMPADRLEESRFLDTVRVEATDIHPPSGIRAAVLEGRNRIPITLHRLVERRLPVRIEMGADERVSDIVLEPETVLVRGPQEILERIRSIPIQLGALPAKSSDTGTTEPIHVEGVPLPQELEGRKVRFSPVAISASMKIQPRQKIHEFAQVPIQFLCPPGFTLRPLFSDERAGKISLRLLGPSGAEAPIITAYVDLSGKKWEPGLYEEPVRLQLPKDFQLTQGPLRPVAFQLVGPDATPRATGAISGP